MMKRVGVLLVSFWLTEQGMAKTHSAQTSRKTYLTKRAQAIVDNHKQQLLALGTEIIDSDIQQVPAENRTRRDVERIAYELAHRYFLDSLGEPAAVVNLDLSKHPCSGTPPTLHQFSNLQWLDLRHNTMVHTGDLRNITKLRVLYLDFHQLATLPDLRILPNLEELYVTDDQLCTFDNLFINRVNFGRFTHERLLHLNQRQSVLLNHLQRPLTTRVIFIPESFNDYKGRLRSLRFSSFTRRCRVNAAG